MRTKILFTFGPASSSKRVFRALSSLAHGVRINTAHGSLTQHAEAIDFIRSNSELPIVLDIKGPELRISLSKPIVLYNGDSFALSFSGPNGFNHNLHGILKTGREVLFQDGKLGSRVVSVSSSGCVLRALNEHTLTNGAGAHIPGLDLNLPPLSKKDLDEIKLANSRRVEFVALSFVRSKEDVVRLRKLLKPEIHIISKIENESGVRNLDSIIQLSDGVMVARGDLAQNIGEERVPLAQKKIISKCNSSGKLAITATQVLETMIDKPHPTRAEISDIANAILDGSDCIMLSGETAVGNYPVQCARVIARVAAQVEPEIKPNVNLECYADVSDAISKSIYAIARIMPLHCIVSVTRSGYTAHMLSRFRLSNPIIAITTSEIVKRQLMLYFGVHALKAESIPDSGMVPFMGKLLISSNLAKPHHTCLFTAGVRTARKHASNMIELHKLSDIT